MQPTKPTPKDWPRISSAVFYEAAGPAIDFLVRAFGFEVKLRVDGPAGRVEHSELVYGRRSSAARVEAGRGQPSDSSTGSEAGGPRPASASASTDEVEGLVMVASLGGRERAVPLPCASPRSLVGGKVTQAMAVFVDDVDAHCAHARKHSAVIADEPATQDYGPEYWADRSYRAIDPEGHHWWFMQRVRDQGVS